MAKQSFGELIAAARKEQNLTLEELSAKTKRGKGRPVPTSTIGSIENGRYTPSTTVGLSIIEALDIPRSKQVEWLKLLVEESDKPVNNILYPRSAEAFNNILDKYNLKGFDVVRQITEIAGTDPVTRAYVIRLTAGRAVLAASMFKILINDVLPANKVRSVDIRTLIHAYTFEVFMLDGKFDYLSKRKKADIAESAAIIASGLQS